MVKDFKTEGFWRQLCLVKGGAKQSSSKRRDTGQGPRRTVLRQIGLKVERMDQQHCQVSLRGYKRVTGGPGLNPVLSLLSQVPGQPWAQEVRTGTGKKG